MPDKAKPLAWWRKLVIGVLGLFAVGMVLADRKNTPQTRPSNEVDQAAPPLPTIATKVDPSTLAVTESKIAEPGRVNRADAKSDTGISQAARLQIWAQVSQEGIRQRLKDPDSAQFRNVFTAKFEGSPVVCGEVNSKNGFGGYTGYQRFIASGQRVGFLEEEMAAGEIQTAWRKLCAHKTP